MTGKAMGEEAGKALVNQVKQKFATNIKKNVTSTTIDLTLQNGVADSSGNLGTLGTTTILPAAVAGSSAGLMSASDKSKLDGISSGANAYTLPTATSTTLGGVKIGSNITNSSGTISVTSANVTGALGYTPATKSTATTSVAGLMSTTDKTKLDRIDYNANQFQLATSTNPDTSQLYEGVIGIFGTGAIKLTVDGSSSESDNYADFYFSHETGSGYRHIPTGGSSGQILRWSSSGTAAWGAENDTTYTAGTGLSLSGTTFSNGGVRSITTGSSNGTITVDTGGTTSQVAVKGLGSAAYTASKAYAAASHTHSYAGSSSAGGAATSANKLNTNAGSATSPVFFANGVPVATNYTFVETFNELMANTIPTCKAVSQAIAAAKTNAAMYKGAANAYTDITGTAYVAGNYWVVKTAGTYAGQACEVGDMIFANTSKGTAAADANFDIIQANIDYLTASDVNGWFD